VFSIHSVVHRRLRLLVLSVAVGHFGDVDGQLVVGHFLLQLHFVRDVLHGRTLEVRRRQRRGLLFLGEVTRTGPRSLPDGAVHDTSWSGMTRRDHRGAVEGDHGLCWRLKHANSRVSISGETCCGGGDIRGLVCRPSRVSRRSIGAHLQGKD